MNDNDGRGWKTRVVAPPDPGTITMPRAQAEALVAAGNAVSELWGELAAGEPIMMCDLDERLAAAGLVVPAGGGVMVLAPVLTDAVVDVAVALGRAEGDEFDGFGGWDDDVAAAEDRLELAEP